LTEGPLSGTKVVEVALATSTVGAGLAAGLPGAILRDLGADVSRVQSARRLSLDAGVEWDRVWNRGKEVIEVVDDRAAAGPVRSLVAEADAVLICGPERLIEQAGLGAHQLGRDHPGLVGARIRPSFNASGPLPELELLVAARAGLPTQIRAHTAGRPAFPDLSVAQAGAALSATVGVLAGLYEREATGAGRWAETSLYDGLLALLPMILGRVEHPSATTRLLWQQQGPAEALVYRCADGGYVQLWFGAKGAFEAFLEHFGDPPSEEGYNAELVSGAMVERGLRWSDRFATRDRAYWLEHLAGHDFRCEPAWRPGEALLDPDVRASGLSADVVAGMDNGDVITVAGPPVSVEARPGTVPTAARPSAGPLLTGLRVLDLSAYLAGPVMPLVLAELGADVVKVEPLTGDAHRHMEPMFAAGQRGKRAVALDMKAPDAPDVLERLFRWSDVVHHNSRVGLAERLGYDEPAVRAANPSAVYSFSSGFGETGRRARLPTNDQLIQALAGIEQGQGGSGATPTFLVWGAVDVTAGWVSACGVLAALYARRRTGWGQRVSSNLLGAGLMLKSGAFVHGGEVVSGPVLDPGQLGYGAAYRLYQGADDRWLAVAAPDAETWSRLVAVTGAGGLSGPPPPLRQAGGQLQPEEVVLAEVFGRRPAAAWAADLAAAAVPAEMVPDADRQAFVAGFVDDPVNRQLGRAVTYCWGQRGQVDQPVFPPRFGPVPRPGAGPAIPGLGQHTAEVLAEIGFSAGARAGLIASGTVGVPPG
jgi:crotonobetainyl-CoA:carnitine CoA-transferase CaiB-like acyl-CoA transferase